MSKVLVLRTCKSDLTSRNGFQWPASGHVIAPDWDPIPECGHGLHGALWGVGAAWLFNWSPTAKWLVVEVEESLIVDLNGKVKFPEGDVVYCGSRLDATQYLQARLPPGSYPVIGSTVTSGDGGSAIAGEGGKGGMIQIKYWDGTRSRIQIGYIGEGGLEPNQDYKLDEKHSFVKV